MSIDKNSGQFITPEQATAFTHAFQNAHPTALKAFFAGSSKINTILEQEGCMGIRIYNGLDDSGANNLVLVGVDKTGQDMTTGPILERLIPCPTDCDEDSILNAGV